jgi:cytochrome c oxidase subunit 2
MDKAGRADYHGMTPHAHWDEVWNETMWDITIIGAIYIAISIVFMFIYRRKAHGERGHWPTLSGQAQIGWLIIPVMLFLGDDLYLFVKGWDLHNQYREVPADAAEVKLTGSMWSWTYELENGIETYDELVVPVGKPVILRMSSDDVVHSHYMVRYRVTEDLMPGRVTYQWFMPDQIGESVVTCREYCGEGHSKMFGKVRVLSQADYDSWVGSQLGEAPKDDAKTVAATTDGGSRSVEKQI